MDRQKRSSLIGGLMLILIGIWFLAVQLVPDLGRVLGIENAWPLFIIAFGALWLLIAIFTGTPGLAVPACVFGGIGALIYWQNLTHDWGSWRYAWALIPGFAGVGTMLMGLLGKDPAKNLRGGVWTIVISLVMFAVFASFLGGPNVLGSYWPVLLIALGIVMLAQNFFRARG
ncbi:MAG: hypothetical protein HZC40_14915 [Chloroflexi bacterium]|nr:hypothetical protein [Chloroflexota bacterium]